MLPSLAPSWNKLSFATNSQVLFVVSQASPNLQKQIVVHTDGSAKGGQTKTHNLHDICTGKFTKVAKLMLRLFTYISSK